MQGNIVSEDVDALRSLIPDMERAGTFYCVDDS